MATGSRAMTCARTSRCGCWLATKRPVRRQRLETIRSPLVGPRATEVGTVGWLAGEDWRALCRGGVTAYELDMAGVGRLVVERRRWDLLRRCRAGRDPECP